MAKNKKQSLELQVSLFTLPPSSFQKPDGTIQVSQLCLEIVGLIITSDFFENPAPAVQVIHG